MQTIQTTLDKTLYTVPKNSRVNAKHIIAPGKAHSENIQRRPHLQLQISSLPLSVTLPQEPHSKSLNILEDPKHKHRPTGPESPSSTTQMSSNLSGYRPLGSRSPTKQPRSNPYYGRGVRSANSGRVGKTTAGSNSSFSSSFANTSGNTSFSRANRSVNLDASILGDVTVNRSLLSNISLVGSASTAGGAARHKTYNPDIRKLVIERKREPADILFGDAPPMGRARRQLTNGDLSRRENSILDETSIYATPAKINRTIDNDTFDMTAETTSNMSMAPYPVNNHQQHRFHGPITTHEGRHNTMTTVSEEGTPAKLPSDYWMFPSLETLKTYTPEQLKNVEGLNIGRKNYGYISWPGTIDLSETDLDSILGFLVIFSLRAVVVYADDTNKPPLGQGLNSPAVITLEHVAKVDRRGNKLVDPTNPRVIRHRQQLQKSIESKDGKHLSYDPASGVWVFQVPHFSRWGVPDSDDEDDEDGEDEGDEDDWQEKAEQEEEEGEQVDREEDIRGAHSQKPYTQAPPLVTRATNASAATNTAAFKPAASAPASASKAAPAPASAPARKAAPAPRHNQKAIPGGWSWTAPVESDDDDDDDEYDNDYEEEQGEENDEMLEDQLEEDDEMEYDDEFAEDQDMSPETPDSQDSSDYENFRQEFAVVNIDQHVRPISNNWLTQLKFSAQAGSPLFVDAAGKPLVDIVSNGSKEIVKIDQTVNLDNLLFTNTLVNVAEEEYNKAAEKLRLPSYSAAVESSLAIFQPSGQLAVKLPHSDLTIGTVSKLCNFSENAQDDNFLGSVKEDMTAADRNNGYPRYSLESVPAHAELKGTVYSLASILFQSSTALGLSEYIGSAPVDGLQARELEASLRKQRLSQWCEKAVFEQVQSELGDNSVENIVTLLTGNRVDEACAACLKTNNVHLGVVISMMGSSASAQSTAQAQLDHWQSTNAMDLIPDYTQQVYQLAAGNIDVVCKARKLDWLREFGLRLWFGRNRDISASIAQIQSSSSDWDLRLLRLYAGKYNLEQTLTGKAFDTAVPWVLCAFFLQGHAKEAPDTADRLTLQYAAQLESMGQVENALLVLGFLVSDSAYAQAITKLVARNIVALRKLDLRSYRIHPQLLSESEALLARYENRPVDEVRYLLDAELWGAANTTVLNDVAPQAVIKGDAQSLEDVIMQFPSPERHIPTWKEGGKVYLDYARFKLSKAVDVLELANGVSHMSKALEEKSQFETRVALHVMSDDIQRSLLLAPTTDDGTKALEVLNEVTLSMKQCVYSAGTRFKASFS
ncbi:YALI0D17886p [Yarrowia lipolytica CLIB122]|uniref:YALI0D17886p n=1 Tax=Yarrowia lipolytica (strain CLIB 122 / E 150) TaxID=284591 RepID=Q6C8Q2_YARLI|nr:YALI0D17886p [Yarrowia lipolytica CLIB122]CAG81152.1 YALI0D17886p [Yarrowia lipolytica CLIB122]|eukprot:XP_502960.1 YALI0D17886p [Yarrowia lipolytica CLIB122]